MTGHSMAHGKREIFVGIDTHADNHVAAALDSAGRMLEILEITTTSSGFLQLETWCHSLGSVVAYGVEGTGSYGAGVARWLSQRGAKVIEVQRPNRQLRRQRGKSDPLDAESAARMVLAGTASATPKSCDREVEMIRSLRIARRSAVSTRTQTINQMKALLVTAPLELRERMRHSSNAELVSTAARFRVGPITTPEAAAKLALQCLAQRHQNLDAEIAQLDLHLRNITTAHAPCLLAVFGVGIDVAGALLVAAGDNPHRIGSEAQFASLCGVAPLPASSGKTRRHRLNRGGDRLANNALWRVVMCRIQRDPRTQEYAARRTQEGLSKREIVRCLKRYVAREIYAAMRVRPA
jgi:transposase